MTYWIGPFTIGVVLGAALVAVGWFGPSLLPPGIAMEMLQPANRLPELVDHYVPDVTVAMQRALALGAAAALIGFITWAVATRAGRPTGPGQVRRGWQWIAWLVLLVFVLAAAGGAAYDSLALRLDTVDAAAASQWTFGVALSAGLAYWLLSVLGAERMMRPAVPLGSLR